VVGWSIDATQTAALVTNALSMAIGNRQPTGDTLIHSDHGVQGGFNQSSQHLDHGGGCGTSSRLDGGEARAGADVVAGAAAGVAS